MGRISASAALPYPPDLVFRVATRVEDLPRWMPEVVAAELLDTPLAVGSRARLRLSPAVAGAEVTASVTDLDPPSRLVLRGAGGPLGVGVQVSLRATASTGTEATVDIDLDTPPFLGFVAREVENRLRAGLPGALERLRALIEAEPA
jgi:uncharacterized protein YndB with AHSA1/START domain